MLKHLGDIWRETAFANAVKDIFCNTFGVSREFVEKWKRIDEPPPNFLMSVRKCLQFIGMGFRSIRQNVWIDLALKEKSVITDGRFLNEAKAVAQKGGINILVWRPGFENDDPNPSEAELLPYVKTCLENNWNGWLDHFHDFHYFLRNDGNLEDLEKKIVKILEKNA